MDAQSDIYDEILKMIIYHTRYMRPRLAQVLDNQDELKQGRVLLAVPSFAWLTQEDGVWASSLERNAITPPEVGQWVIIEWLDGDINKPRYRDYVPEMQENKLTKYSGLPTKRLLFESPKQHDYIEHNDNTGDLLVSLKNELKVLCKKISLLDGTEPFVLGNQLNTFLSNLITQLTTELGNISLGIAAAGGSYTPGTLSSPSGLLSSVIKGK